MAAEKLPYEPLGQSSDENADDELLLAPMRKTYAKSRWERLARTRWTLLWVALLASNAMWAGLFQGFNIGRGSSKAADCTFARAADARLRP